MSKKDVIKKIQEIIDKDPSFKGAKVTVKFKEKKDTPKQS